MNLLSLDSLLSFFVVGLDSLALELNFLIVKHYKMSEQMEAYLVEIQYKGSYNYETRLLNTGIEPSSLYATTLPQIIAQEKEYIRPQLDVKLSHLASGTDSSTSIQITETKLADLLDSTLWNHRLASSSERIVYGL
ncbi:hypothetical protein S245_009114, partial [Arachis hypogaea]